MLSLSPSYEPHYIPTSVMLVHRQHPMMSVAHVAGLRRFSRLQVRSCRLQYGTKKASRPHCASAGFDRWLLHPCLFDYNGHVFCQLSASWHQPALPGALSLLTEEQFLNQRKTHILCCLSHVSACFVLSKITSCF